MQTLNVEISGTPVISLLNKGDEHAFERVFKTFYKPLYGYAFSMLKDDAEADEMVQRVFFNIWNKRERLVIEGTLKSYLYRAVRNECLNYLKHQKVRAAYQTNVAARPEKNTSRADGRLVAGELQEQIQRALNQLPPQCRTVFQLSRFEQMKYREIADELSISVKTVENQMGKALRIMRHKLAEFLPLLLVLLKLTQ